MACDSRKNTINFLTEREIINNTGVILDYPRFIDLNKKYTEYAKAKYGVDAGQLFDIRESKVRELRGHGRTRDNISTVYRAVPNEEAFRQIDNVINTDEQYEMDFQPDPNINYNITPKYERYIIYKENLLARANKRLRSIEIEKERNSTDINKIKELTVLENAIKQRIQNDFDFENFGLAAEILQLKDAPPIEKFKYYAETDFERLEAVANSENAQDLQEARTIINFYKEIGTFDIKSKHPLFENSDMFDEEGNLVLPENIVEELVDLRERAQSFENRIANKEKKALTDTLQEITGNENTYEEFFMTEKGLKDTSWLDMFIMDTTNGIWSHNGIVPQAMFKILEDAIGSNLVYAKSVESRLDEILPEVQRKLRELGYDNSIPGLKDVSYDIFRAKNENGLYRDAIIQRYSHNFTSSRNKMFFEFNGKIDAARAETDPVKAKQLFKEAYLFRNNWYRKNTILIDIRKIGEITSDPALAEFSEHFVQDDDYKDRLINVLGENGYREEVDKQKKLLQDYKTAHEVFVDTVLTENRVTDIDSLSDKEKNKIKIWEKSNNPFLTAKNYYSANLETEGGTVINPTMAYNYSVPRRNKIKVVSTPEGPALQSTNEDTGFYDERFEVIDNNPILKDFHDILSEVQTKISDTMPEEVRKNFNAFSLPALQKSLTEILFDPNTPILKRISEAYRFIIDKIRSMFGTNVQDSFSYATIDPITGQPDYKINSSFLRSNKRLINNRHTVEIQRIKSALGIRATDRILKYETFDVRHNPEVIQILTENLGIPNNINALRDRLSNEDLANLEISRVLEDSITHQVVAEHSFDLPKILKMYSYMTAEYAARQEALPILESLKRHYEEIKAPATNNIGQNIINVSTDETRLEGFRANGVKQMNSWFNRAVLGDYSSKNEFKSDRLKKIFDKKVSDEDQIELLANDLKTNSTGRIFNTREKILRKRIPGIVEELEEIIKTSTSQAEIAEAENILKNLNRVDKNLGKYLSATSFIDAIFNFTRFTGLAWNLSSSVTNYAEGQIANMINASTGDYFTPENIYKATNIVGGSFVKNNSFGTIQTPGAKKTRALMDKYNILQDASNELQKASSKSAFTSFKNLSSFEVVRRVEYLNQAPLMISILMDQEITGKDGSKSTVWDAMNTDGTLKENFNTEENISNWENVDGEQYNNFKSHINKTIVNIHGDYQDIRGNMGTEYISGKALLMFKRWMGRQIYQRFAVTQPDLELGIEEFKGRYYSHTSTTGLLHGAILGFGGLSVLGAGPIGLLIGGALGFGVSKFYGAKTGTSFIKELAYTSKELVLNLMRIPVNTLAGRNIIREEKFSAFTGLDERNMRNLRANLVDMSLTLAWMGLLIFTKSLLWDDDPEDEEGEQRRKWHNLLANRFMQLSSQATMYLDPIEFWDNTFGNVAVLRFVNNVGKLAVDAEQVFEGKDIIPTGINAGESAFMNQLEKTFYPSVGRTAFGFGSQMDRQFQPSPFDTWFHGEERKAKDEIRRYKLQAQRKYLTEEMSDKKREKITKEIDAFYRKDKDKEYQDILEKIERKDYKP